MLEKSVENRLVEKVKQLGGLCWKFTSESTIGVPDRIVLFRGKCFFVELKRPGAKPGKMQLYRHRQIKNQGIPVLVIDSLEGVDKFIEELDTLPEKSHESISW